MPYTTLSSANDLLANPFSKNPFGTTNTGIVTMNPTSTMGISTKNPILELKPSTGAGVKFEKGQAMKDFESSQKLKTKIQQDKAIEKDSWWDKRSKGQKIGIIAGSVVATVGIIILIRKAIK